MKEGKTLISCGIAAIMLIGCMAATPTCTEAAVNDDTVNTIHDSIQNNQEQPKRNIARERKIELSNLTSKWKQEDVSELAEQEINTKIDNRLAELKLLEDKWSNEDSEIEMTPYETINYRSLKKYVLAIREKLERDRTSASGKYNEVTFDSYINALTFMTEKPYELTDAKKYEVQELLVLGSKLGITKSNSASELKNDFVAVYTLSKSEDDESAIKESGEITDIATGLIVLDRYIVETKHGGSGYPVTGSDYNVTANVKDLENFTAAMEYGGFDITEINEDIVTIAEKDLAANNVKFDTDAAIMNIYNNASVIVHELNNNSAKDASDIDFATLWKIEKIRNAALHYAVDNIDSGAFYTSLENRDPETN